MMKTEMVLPDVPARRHLPRRRAGFYGNNKRGGPTLCPHYSAHHFSDRSENTLIAVAAHLGRENFIGSQ